MNFNFLLTIIFIRKRDKQKSPSKTDGLFVGVAGFEPATLWSQTRCANRTALHPEDLYPKKWGKYKTYFIIVRRLCQNYFRLFRLF